MLYHIIYQSIDLAEKDYEVLDRKNCKLILTNIEFEDLSKGCMLIIEDRDQFKNYVDVIEYLDAKVNKRLAKSEDELLKKYGSIKKEREYTLSDIVKTNSTDFVSIYASCYV